MFHKWITKNCVSSRNLCIENERYVGIARNGTMWYWLKIYFILQNKTLINLCKQIYKAV